MLETFVGLSVTPSGVVLILTPEIYLDIKDHIVHSGIELVEE